MPFNSVIEERSTATEKIGRSETDITLFEIVLIITRRQRMIMRFTVAAAIVAGIVALLLPNIYTAKTKILPPQQSQSIASAFLGQLGPLASLAGKDLVRSPNDTYMEMLQSQTVLEALVNSLGLKDAYRESSINDAADRLKDATRITASKAGIITVEVDDKSPKRAAEIANAYVEELFKTTQMLASKEASQRRAFFDLQRKNAMDDLAKAESELKSTQESTGMIQLDTQAKAIIESVAAVRAQIVAKEVQLHAMRSFGTEQNPDIKHTEQELGGLRTQLANLQDKNSSVGDTQIPTKQIPEAGLAYMRKLRDVKYYEAVFELLAKEYELAKLDESRNAAIIQVLDKATEPERKSKPKRALIVFVVAILAAFLAMVWAFVQEFLARMKTDPEFKAKFRSLMNEASRISR